MTTPRLSRRDLLKLSAAGVAGVSLSGWLEGLASAAVAPAVAALADPAVDAGRPQSDRHLRSQAGARQRRAVPTAADPGARADPRRAPAGRAGRSASCCGTPRPRTRESKVGISLRVLPG